MHTRLPTPSVPLDGRALRRSSCGPLVPGERESLGLSPYPSPAGSAETQDLRRCPPVSRPGDHVWLSTRDLRLCLPRKLSPRYIGPFTIERQINEVTFLLQLPARYRIHPAFHISLLKPFSPSVPGTEELAAPPPPEVQAEPSIYRVRDILDSRRQAGHLEYLIDWEGYGSEERSWVARDDVLDPSILA